MSASGDKMVTNRGSEVASHTNPAVSEGGKSVREPKRRKSGKPGPHAVVKFGSASVPVYRTQSAGRVRYTVCSYRDGKRIRKIFSTPNAAKDEAMVIARQIQSGMQHVTDLKPHERDSFKAAESMLAKSGLPLVAAVEDYLRARDLAGTESLSAMAEEYGRHFKKVVRQASTAAVVEEMLRLREQDGASKAYLRLLKTTLTRFAAKFPGPVLEITGPDVDAWLRSLDVALCTRNSMLRCIKIFFSFARSRNYLPEERNTAAEHLKVAKVVTDDMEIFDPKTMERLLYAAPPDLIPILAIGAFSGIRMAELNRLDWSAVDMERRIIEVRAGQAKTGSRRVIPVTDNLAAWLEPLERKGRVVPSVKAHHRAVAAHAKALKIDWPRNVLRHSFISYRIAQVKSADQVALEAGNSPSIIFKNYRELTTEEQAEKWFGILPKDGLLDPPPSTPAKRRVAPGRRKSRK
jgi:integrase